MKRTGHKGPGRDATSSKAIETARRHAKWVEDRVEGLTYRQIAERDGVSHSTVQEAVAKELAKVGAERAKELKKLHHVRHERMIHGLWPRAKKGDDKATAQVLKIHEREAKLFGADAPAESKTKLTIVGQITWVLDLIREELGEDAAQRIYRRIAESGGEEADPEDEARPD